MPKGPFQERAAGQPGGGLSLGLCAPLPCGPAEIPRWQRWPAVLPTAAAGRPQNVQLGRQDGSRPLPSPRLLPLRRLRPAAEVA